MAAATATATATAAAAAAATTTATATAVTAASSTCYPIRSLTGTLARMGLHPTNPRGLPQYWDESSSCPGIPMYLNGWGGIGAHLLGFFL